MRLKRIKIGLGLFVLAIGLVMTGCNENMPTERVGLPIVICLPANEVQSAARMPIRRSIGDPGQREEFRLPNYIYIIIMKQDGENWMLWKIEEHVASAVEWEKTRYAGALPTQGDSIYKYKEEISLPLNQETFNGRVYAVASAVPLTFNKNPLNTIASLSDVENLTFSAASDSIQANLQNIYSTPYNFKPDDANYYGSFTTYGRNVPYVNILLYHVAAKVDINWTVAKDKRINKEHPENAVRVTKMEACNLFNGNAYCFKPLENTSGASPLTAGDTIRMIGSGDEGLWWEGRAYFYTILYRTTETDKKSHFPLQMLLKTNDSEGADYKSTIYMKIDTLSPFVPWMRADFNLNAPLEAGGGTTKTVGD